MERAGKDKRQCQTCAWPRGFCGLEFPAEGFGAETPIPMPSSTSASPKGVGASVLLAQKTHLLTTTLKTHQQEPNIKIVQSVDSKDLTSHIAWTMTYATRVSYKTDTKPLFAPNVESRLAPHRLYILLTATAKLEYA